MEILKLFSKLIIPIAYLFFHGFFLQTDAIRALTGEKMHTMQLMVEQERRYVEQIRQDLVSTNSAKLQMELDSAVKRLAKLEQQLDDLKAGKVRSKREVDDACWHWQC